MLSNVASNVRRRSFLLDRLTAWRGWYRHAKHSRQELCESSPEFSTHITTRQARSSVSTRFSASRPMSVHSFICLKRFPGHMSKPKCAMPRTSITKPWQPTNIDAPPQTTVASEALPSHPINNAPINPVTVSITVTSPYERQMSTVVRHMSINESRQLQP